MLSNTTVIILSYNEEANLPYALSNIVGWTKDIFVVDSYSIDKTCEIAEKAGAKVFKNKFENYAKQKNWALEKLPINTEWVMFLDADEYLTEELKKEIEVILPKTDYDGFYMKRRFYFMGRWIKHGGYYPTWLLRIFKRGKGRVEREVNEHVKVDGKIGYLENDFTDYNRKGLVAWLTKHIKYAEMEAALLIRQKVEAKNISFLRDFLKGTPERKKKWLREKIFNNSPLFARAILLFIYRYFFRLGFLDGKEGLIFHFLQGLWFWFIVDVLYLQNKLKSKKYE